MATGGRDQQVARVEPRVESRWAAARRVESSRVYEEDDTVDEGLLNQLKGWIMYNRLPTLARHLGFTEAEITRIILQESTPEDRIFKVSFLLFVFISVFLFFL